MLSALPPKLKTPELHALAKRAGQLENVKPSISYWCYYQIVDHILKHGLHAQGGEAMSYTTELMDKLEEMKTKHPGDDTIIDDVAAQAYVEQFALDTFKRAENAMDANKVSNQTADTFLAAATFLDLLQIWNTPTPDISAKVKFAKYHALRIVRATKAGEDPNATNPIKSTQTEEEEALPLDPEDPDVQAINNPGSVYEPPSVTDEQGSADARPEPTAVVPIPPDDRDKDQLLPHSVPLIVPTSTSDTTSSAGLQHASTLTNTSALPNAPLNAAQAEDEGYFPTVSPPSRESGTPAVDNYAVDAPISPVDAKDLNTASNLPRPLGQSGNSHFPPTATSPAPLADSRTFTPAAVIATPPVVRPVPIAASVVASATVPATTLSSGPFLTDDDAVAAAMKHAKWASSALNFDDVPTAVKELREALRRLGALDLRTSVRRLSAPVRAARGARSTLADNLAFTVDSRSASSTSLKPSLSVATNPYGQRSAENLGSAFPPSSYADGRHHSDLALRRIDSGRPPATSHGVIGRDRGESTTTFTSSLAPASSVANSTASLDNQRIPEICSKRVNTMEYLRKTNEGRVYWFNTLLFEKPDLARMPYFDEAKLARRAMNYLLLGLSLPYQLDSHDKNALEFVRAFNALLTEFEAYQAAHPPEGGASSSLSRVRMGQMFKRAASSTGSKRRGSGTEAFSSLSDTDLRSVSGATSYGTLMGTRDELMPGEEYNLLLTPSLPFEPDYFETFATLCDVLIDCYTRIIALLSTTETDVQTSAELGAQFAKADSKVRKILMAAIIRDYEDTSKQGVRSELAGVGKVVLGGLM